MSRLHVISLLAFNIFYIFMVVSLFRRTTLHHFGILAIQRGSSRIKPSWHGCSSCQFLRLVSLCNSLHQPKPFGMNGLPCMAMSLISPKSLRHMSSQGYYANIHGLLPQLKLYQSYMIDLTSQRHYREELVVAIFLGGLDTSISSQIQGSILSKTHLLSLSTTFSYALWVSNGTPLLPSLAPLSLSSSNSMAFLSSNSKGKGHHTNGGRGRGQGHDGQPFPLCQYC